MKRFSSFLLSPILGISLPVLASVNKQLVSEAKAVQELCLPTREFITTLNFLRSHKELQIKELDARSIAKKVSAGCYGAAARFIKTTTLLSKVGLDSSTTLKHATKLSNVSDEKVKVFIDVFKLAYDEKFFDLNPIQALNHSLSLTVNFKGNSTVAKKDYESIANFCQTDNGSYLSPLKCAKLAKSIALKSEEFNQELSQTFINFLNFSSLEKNGPKLTRDKALEISKNLISYGPNAFKNFKEAFLFSTSKKGLDLDYNKSLKFSINMAKQSYRKIKN